MTFFSFSIFSRCWVEVDSFFFIWFRFVCASNSKKYAIMYTYCWFLAEYLTFYLTISKKITIARRHCIAVAHFHNRGTNYTNVLHKKCAYRHNIYALSIHFMLILIYIYNYWEISALNRSTEIRRSIDEILFIHNFEHGFFFLVTFYR